MTQPTFPIPALSVPSSPSMPPPVAIVPPENDIFQKLPTFELDGVLSTANHRFFGLNMSQHPQAPFKLNQILNASAPARIIEIGAGNGGLTVLFALYCSLVKTCTLHAYDKTAGLHAGLLESMGYPVALKDVLEDPVNVAEVAALVAQPGRTLLMCDAGKALEANLYIPHMKVGDIIMMHDFSPTAATFERDIKGRVWNWHEAWYERVAETCHKHGIVHSNWTNDVVWSLGYRAQ